MPSSLFQQFGQVPVHSQALRSSFKGYRAPMGKIALLQRQGQLLSLRRNLYVCLPEEGNEAWCRELIANHILHPSYISYETVLSGAGVIPERVYAIKSACMKRSKVFDNATGHYEYIQVPRLYFPVGLTRVRTAEGYFYLAATPEKALCDLIVATDNLRIQSIKAMRSYLEDYLRADRELIARMDADAIRACAATTNKKKKELEILERMIRHECI